MPAGMGDAKDGSEVRFEEAMTMGYESMISRELGLGGRTGPGLGLSRFVTILRAAEVRSPGV